MEDRKLVELLKNGYISEMGLELRKEVICMVESFLDQKKLEVRLLEFSKSYTKIRRWVGILDDQEIQRPSPKIEPNLTATLDDFFKFDASRSFT